MEKPQKDRKEEGDHRALSNKLTPSVSHIKKMRSSALTQGVVSRPVAASSSGAFG
jgi:hypothetical protein